MTTITDRLAEDQCFELVIGGMTCADPTHQNHRYANPDTGGTTR
jgi:hypothetical protein